MKQALDTRTKLLTKNPWPLMIELSIPAVLGMVVVGLYNMMDSITIKQKAKMRSSPSVRRKKRMRLWRL